MARKRRDPRFPVLANLPYTHTKLTRDIEYGMRWVRPVITDSDGNPIKVDGKYLREDKPVLRATKSYDPRSTREGRLVLKLQDGAEGSARGVTHAEYINTARVGITHTDWFAGKLDRMIADEALARLMAKI